MWLGLFRLSFLSPSSDRWILHCRRADHFPNPDQHSQNRFPEPRSISTVKTGALGYLFSDDDESIAEPVKKQGKKKTGVCWQWLSGCLIFARNFLSCANSGKDLLRLVHHDCSRKI